LTPSTTDTPPDRRKWFQFKLSFSKVSFSAEIKGISVKNHEGICNHLPLGIKYAYLELQNKQKIKKCPIAVRG
jgi:hypothetical protein